MKFDEWHDKTYPHHKAIDVISGEVCAQRMREAFKAAERLTAIRCAEIAMVNTSLVHDNYNHACYDIFKAIKEEFKLD